MTGTSIHRFAVLVAAAALHACSVAPLPPLDEEVPPDWAGRPVGDWPAEDWWNGFGSDELSELMGRVQARNLGLKNGERALRQAQLALIDAGFDLYPTPIADFATSTTYTGSKPPGGDFSDARSESASLSVGIGYTDILTKPYRFESAEATFESAVAQLASTRLNLLGTTASTYFSILFTRDQIEAAKRNLENAETIGRITQARVEAGVLTHLDGLQQQIQVQRQRNALAQLRQQEY